MQGLQLTFNQLAESLNTAAVDLLIDTAGATDPSMRLMAMEALLKRSEPECGDVVLTSWETLDLHCRRLLRKKKQWLYPAIEKAIQERTSNLARAISATEALGINNVICLLVPIVETHPSEVIRVSAMEAILELAREVGRDARAERGQSSDRTRIVAALAESVQRYNKHRNDRLVDAFLMVCTWSDRELRALVAPDSPVESLLADRFRTTQRVGIVELLTGFLGRRNVPMFMKEILASRTDEVYRDFFLRMIGHEPSSIILRNLSEIGIPRCCFGDAKLMDQISPDHRAAAVFVYSQAHTDVIAYLRTVVAAINRGGPGVTTAAVLGLSKCEIPEAKVWLRAAIVLSGKDRIAIQADRNASLLEELIELLDNPDAALVRSVRRILKPLHVASMLDRLQALPEEHRRAIGRIVLVIDADAIPHIRDGLRHPVLKKRLAAIAAADALSAVDLLTDAFERISREDHQEARVRACEVMANAESLISLSLLQEMAALPPCPVRDAAVKALSKRSVAVA
ncbi:hypothetical protein CA13_37260 [Planctomycetes bacterium CA13]|uniref:HEAT repeat protein n=1 Tax=Novipirellula herctigrandis TaxID=2527986 RepID=A0A5C5Z4U2_9BACT|nr:hypothetical protein CA13_37260 [Planctomycetes bacterium CA13]